MKGQHEKLSLDSFFHMGSRLPYKKPGSAPLVGWLVKFSLSTSQNLYTKTNVDMAEVTLVTESVQRIPKLIFEGSRRTNIDRINSLHYSYHSCGLNIVVHPLVASLVSRIRVVENCVRVWVTYRSSSRYSNLLVMSLPMRLIWWQCQIHDRSTLGVANVGFQRCNSRHLFRPLPARFC